MIIVTGGAGFIGSNLIRQLNRRGEKDILVVDNLTNGKKVHNIADLDIADYVDKTEFLGRLETGAYPNIRAVFHQGACSATTEWDGKYVMANNYEYSKRLLAWCASKGVSFLYASSASVYGSGANGFRVDRGCEHPINMYAYSKFQFDQHVRAVALTITSQVVGFRYFNVYGPGEQHKGSMSSPAFHFRNQVREHGNARLFAGSDGFGDGEQKRDFVFVDDVVKVNLWFLDNPQQRGIFNVGTGKAATFNDMARAVLAWHGKGKIEYIPFPEHLKGAYQSFTEADISGLRDAGYLGDFVAVADGVTSYLNTLGRVTA
jgi:ADP-L-glycero-D-manno-heptose 6-epimerase